MARSRPSLATVGPHPAHGSLVAPGGKRSRVWWWPGRVQASQSTGVSWKPVSQILRAAVEGYGAKSHEVRQWSGYKTDQREAPWLAELLAPGLITPSVG